MEENQITENGEEESEIEVVKGYPRSKAIRDFCISCMGNQNVLVKYCSATSCPLWRYRSSSITMKANPELFDLKQVKTQKPKRRKKGIAYP